jgi:hypothetical protein
MKPGRAQIQDSAPAAQPGDREAARPRVTVGELLRLKRAERPSPEFWASFEKQLKQRQLASAIHEKTSWWRAIPATLPRFAIALSTGAVTATLAIGIIVWRTGARQAAAPAEPAGSALATTAPAKASAEKTGAGIATLANSLSHDTATSVASSASVVPASGQIAQTQPHPAPAATVAIATDENTRGGNTLGSTTPSSPAPDKPTAAELAAAQPVSGEHARTAQAAFAMTASSVRAPDFTLVTLAGARTTSTTAIARNILSSTLMAMPVLAGDLPASTTGMDGASAEKISDATIATTYSATPGSTAVETSDAKTDDAAGDPRYERLLSYMDTVATAPAQTPDDNPRVVRVRDRATSRLNNKILTDSVSRFGATGDSLSIKF